MPSGRLGDARSRRAVFVAGVALFTLASAAAGAAPNPTLLSIARVVQGIGGGMIAPQVSGFIQNLFRGAERARAFGLFGATVGISTAIGPLLGGLLVNLGGPELGWRLVFYVNVPIGAVLIPLALRILPRREGERRRQSLDPVGVGLFAASVLLILFPLVEGKQNESLSQRAWWLLLPAFALLVIFYFWERRWNRLGRETLIDLALLKVRSYMFGLTLGTFYFAGFTAIFLVTTLYLQVGLHYTALQAGATQTPFAIGSAIAATLGSRLVPRFGRALVVVGLVHGGRRPGDHRPAGAAPERHGRAETGARAAARRLRRRTGDHAQRDPDPRRGATRAGPARAAACCRPPSGSARPSASPWCSRSSSTDWPPTVTTTRPRCRPACARPSASSWSP